MPSSGFFGPKSMNRLSYDVRLDPGSERMLELMVLLLDDEEDSASDGVRMVSLSLDDLSWLGSAYSDSRGRSDSEDGFR